VPAGRQIHAVWATIGHAHGLEHHQASEGPCVAIQAAATVCLGKKLAFRLSLDLAGFHCKKAADFHNMIGTNRRLAALSKCLKLRRFSQYNQ